MGGVVGVTGEDGVVGVEGVVGDDGVTTSESEPATQAVRSSNINKSWVRFLIFMSADRIGLLRPRYSRYFNREASE